MISVTDKSKGQFSKFSMKKKLNFCLLFFMGGILCVHFLVTVFSSDGIYAFELQLCPLPLADVMEFFWS